MRTGRRLSPRLPGRRADQRFLALVADLQSLGPGNTLRKALRESLGDPELDISYLRLGSGGWIDDLGLSMATPVGTDGRAVTPVHRAGKPFAALLHDPALLRRPKQLHAAIEAAALAFDNEQLKADLRAEVYELRESRARIVQAVDVERRRAERNLHDGAQQRLVGLSLMLRLAGRKAAQDPALATALDEAARELDDALAELRELARGMHPAIVAAAGLTAGLETLAERPGVPVRLFLDLPAELPGLVEVAAYYAVAEAVTNANKHANATLITVRAAVTDEVLAVSIVDDGRGGAAPAPGSGLEGLADRLDALGGTLRITSGPDGGTAITAELPLADHATPERHPDSFAALCWVGWEMFEIPAEAYRQLTHEDQRSWVRGVFAFAGGVSRVPVAQRDWIISYEAAAGAAGWVLESLRAHEADERLEDILALPGMEYSGRALLYDTIRMFSSDGELTAAEVAQLYRSTAEVGLPRELVADLRDLVEKEHGLRARRYSTITAPALPAALDFGRDEAT